MADIEKLGRRDMGVAGRSSAWWRIALVGGALLGMRAAPARACSTLGPGILARSVWPGPDQQPPVNTRLAISYQVGGPLMPGLEIPELGPDLILLDGDDGKTVDRTTQVVGSTVFIYPAAPLLPDHSYQIADRRSVPCFPGQQDCGLTPQAQVFAAFMTSDSTDVTPPTFGGLKSLAFDARLICGDGACCGPYNVAPASFSWDPASDDTAGTDVRYNVYRTLPGGVVAVALVAGLIDATDWRGYQTCSGNSPFAPSIGPGTYLVRAVDWVGNEGAGGIFHALGDGCARPTVSPPAGGCAVAGSISDDVAAFWGLLALAVGRGGLRRSRRTPLPG